MTDAELDQKIRAMSAELVESSPAAPGYDELYERAGVAVTRVDVMFDQRPDDDPRRPGFWQKTLGVLGLGVAIGGGAFALAALTDDDGADTPQAAVEEFIEAIAAEDAIGVAETLVPPERDLVLDHLDPILAELQRLDVAGEDADARDVSGLEFTADVESLRLQESPLTDTVTRIRILDGNLGLDADFDALPVGGTVRETGPLEDPDPVDLLVDVFGGQADVVAVKDSDGWHVSVFYTLAEYLRAQRGLPSVGLGSGPTPVGAESPEAVMAALIDGAAAGDLASVLTLADPVEGAVLYDYWPVIRQEWGADIDQAAADGPFAEVHSYETSVAGDGDERVVSLVSWDYTASYGPVTDDAARTSFDGSCFTGTYEVGYEAVGSDEEVDPFPTDGCVRETAEFEGATLTALRVGLADVAVVQRDGRWYVRPGATLIESWLANTALIDGTDSLSPVGLLFRAFPSPPAWGFGLDPLAVGRISMEEVSESGTSGTIFMGGPCVDAAGAELSASCFSEVFGTPVTAEDVTTCEAGFDGPADSDEITRYLATETCIVELLFPPTPRDLFLAELATCPGGGSPDAAEAAPEEQQALIECARGIFRGDNVPEEILVGMAGCLGVEPDALPSVTDPQALIDCGIQVLAGAAPMPDDPPDVAETIVYPTTVVEQAAAKETAGESATPVPGPTSTVVGEG